MGAVFEGQGDHFLTSLSFYIWWVSRARSGVQINVKS
jgi:hypothetical protein